MCYISIYELAGAETGESFHTPLAWTATPMRQTSPKRSIWRPWIVHDCSGLRKKRRSYLQSKFSKNATCWLGHLPTKIRTPLKYREQFDWFLFLKLRCLVWNPGSQGTKPWKEYTWQKGLTIPEMVDIQQIRLLYLKQLSSLDSDTFWAVWTSVSATPQDQFPSWRISTSRLGWIHRLHRLTAHLSGDCEDAYCVAGKVFW